MRQPIDAIEEAKKIHAEIVLGIQTHGWAASDLKRQNRARNYPIRDPSGVSSQRLLAIAVHWDANSFAAYGVVALGQPDGSGVLAFHRNRGPAAQLPR